MSLRQCAGMRLVSGSGSSTDVARLTFVTVHDNETGSCQAFQVWNRGALTSGSPSVNLMWSLAMEAVPFVLIVMGLLVILGAIRPQRVIMLIVIVLFMPFIAAFVDELFAVLPAWVRLLFLVAIGLAIIRAIMSAIIGRGASDQMVGTLAADVVRLALRMTVWLVAFPFRMLAQAARGLRGA